MRPGSCDSQPEFLSHGMRDLAPGPAGLSGENLREGWTDRMLFDTVAAVLPGACRLERTASRSAFASPLRKPGPVGSAYRPNLEVAQEFVTEMDHTPGLLRS